MSKKFILLVVLFFFNKVTIAEPISILLAGDTMLGNKTITENIFGEALPILKKDYDMMFFNIEGTLGNIGIDNKNPKCVSGKYCFTFMSPPETIDILKNTNKKSIFIFNMANNHSMDYGKTIQNSTFNLLSNYGKPIGYINYPSQEMIIKNKKIVWLGASPHNETLSIFSDRLYDLVKQYKKENYIVIVSLHMGAEGNDKYNVEDKDEFLGNKNRGNIYQTAHKLIDSGADLIVGHGPHILRGIEKYKNKIILYSLGNFLTYGSFSLSGNASMSVLVEISLDNEGNLVQGKINGYQQTKSINTKLWNKQIALINNNKSAEWLNKLSKTNFKNTVIFDNNNNFK